MLFNSMAYAIFLPLVFLIYWIIPHKFRWILLLISSYYFYMSWNAKYVVLILTTTCISYICAILLERFDAKTMRRLILLMSLLVCLGILFVFKYYNWTMSSLSSLFKTEVKPIDLILPVGISFYTFQTLGYVIDVYRRDIQAERHFGIYATFISFFPQLVAGPIERTGNLLPQIKAEHKFNYEESGYGIRLILWGLYKKVVIADNLGLMVDKVYGAVGDYSGFSLLLATLFFSFQIYCDFSGYSDIARGSAQLLGIKLIENFKSPYFSASIREFWSRWHISLSSWFRDYVYIPLGGNRVSKIRNIVNTIATFLISGLWHGASWSFVAWGGAHGVAQIYENAFGIKKQKERDIYWWIRVFCVFCFAMIVWLFFRANSMRDSMYVVRYMFSGIWYPIQYLKAGIETFGIDLRAGLRLIIVYLLPLCLFDYFSLREDIIAWIGKKRSIIRHTVMIIIVLVILLYGYYGQSTFVYFQF